MRGLNRFDEPKVTLIGNRGGNPEIQKLQGDVNIAGFSLATTETFKDAKGQLHSTTDWHAISLWRGLADLADRSAEAKVPAKGRHDLRGRQAQNA